jgi:DNA-binding transcriptional LysR family regulator
MELRHLKYFATVAEELSFRRAGEVLHLAQPSLSAQIKDLEEELGVKLLERTTRSVRLTQAGQVFLEDARRILAAAEQARRRALAADQEIVGVLRLGVLAPTANAWLAEILRNFRKQLPGVQLSLFDLTSTEQIRRLRAGELDAGFLRPPVGFPELDFLQVGESEQVLAVPTGHHLAKKHRLSWIDFHEEPLVLIDPTHQHAYYDAFFAACAKAGAKLGPIQYAHDIQTKMWLISAGFGVAPTTATIAEITRPGLLFRALPAGLPRVQTILVWRRDDPSPALGRFRKMFKPQSAG